MTTRMLAGLLAVAVTSSTACANKKDENSTKRGPAKLEKTGSGERGSPEQRALRLQKTLDLSDEQRVAVEAVLRDHPGADQDQAQVAIRALLEPDQLAKYDELGARRDPQRVRRGFTAAAERAAWLHKELGLDDAQRDKLTKLLETGNTRAQRLAAVKEILTAEQFAEYEEMRANRSEFRPRDGFKAPAERAAWLHKELVLDDVQRDQLEKMFKIVKSREEVAERLGMILSKEQLARYDELTANRLRVRDGRAVGEPAPAVTSPEQP